MQVFCVKFEHNVVYPLFNTPRQDFFSFSTPPVFMCVVTTFFDMSVLHAWFLPQFALFFIAISHATKVCTYLLSNAK